MTYPILTTTGTVHHIGHCRFNNDTTSITAVEVSTANGLVELKGVVCPTAVMRALVVGKLVTISYTEVAGKSASLVIWGVLDVEENRVFRDDRFLGMRKNQTMLATGGALQYGLGGLIGLAFFVLPGLLIWWAYYQVWQAALAWPTSDEITTALATLGATPAMQPARAG